jgi:hypothetical protein
VEVESRVLLVGGELGDQREIVIKKEAVLLNDTNGALPTRR